MFKNREIIEDEKQELTIEYSKNLLITSLKILLIFLFIFIFFYIVGYILPNFRIFIFSLFGIVEATIIFFIYHLIRKKFNDKL